MLKTIALAGIFIFTSAVSTAAVKAKPQKKASPTQSAPSAPQPSGFCWPPGNSTC